MRRHTSPSTAHGCAELGRDLNPGKIRRILFSFLTEEKGGDTLADLQSATALNPAAAAAAEAAARVPSSRQPGEVERIRSRLDPRASAAAARVLDLVVRVNNEAIAIIRGNLEDGFQKF